MTTNSIQKMLQNILLMLSVVFVINSSIKAQQTGMDSMFMNPKVDIESLLPPLDSLLEIAVKNSPKLKMELAYAKAYDWNEKYIRWSWAQNLSIFYNYSFGNIPLIAGVVNTGALTTITDGYRAGVNVSLSVFDVMGQKSKVNEVKEKAKGQRLKRDAEATEYKRQLALLYSDMVGYNRVFKSRNEDLLTQMIACQVAEKEYKEGAIHIAEYARQKNILANAEAAYHESFRLYMGSLEQFEALFGNSLSKVAIKRK